MVSRSRVEVRVEQVDLDHLGSLSATPAAGVLVDVGDRRRGRQQHDRGAVLQCARRPEVVHTELRHRQRNRDEARLQRTEEGDDVVESLGRQDRRAIAGRDRTGAVPRPRPTTDGRPATRSGFRRWPVPTTAPSMKVYAVACRPARRPARAATQESTSRCGACSVTSSRLRLCFTTRVGHPSRMSDGQRTREGWPAIVANQGFPRHRPPTDAQADQGPNLSAASPTF